MGCFVQKILQSYLMKSNWQESFVFNQAMLDKSNYGAAKLSHYYPFHQCFNTSAPFTTSPFTVVYVGCAGALFQREAG